MSRLSNHEAGRLREAYCRYRDHERDLQEQENLITKEEVRNLKTVVSLKPKEDPKYRRYSRLVNECQLDRFRLSQIINLKGQREVDKFLKVGSSDGGNDLPIGLPRSGF